MSIRRTFLPALGAPGRGFASPAPALDGPAGGRRLAVGPAAAAEATTARDRVKRSLDVALAAAALLVLAPLVAVIALAVTIADGGPVLYSQWRVGRGGELFRMLKFRSMLPDAEPAPPGRPPAKYREDGRVTPVGRILRRTSLDELPQLLHVLTGRMSIVGPRPLPLYEAPAVPGWAAGRWSLRPGLTCIWQVEGRSDVGWEERMELDRLYAGSRTTAGDLRLMLRTLEAVVSGRGAY